MILIILTFLRFPLLPTPEAMCLSYLNHFQELMLGDIFLQEEWLSHGTIYPRK